ncbi:MAG: 3-dehydroquinate synthase [Proteobacteria bacterium]|nr:3-dehydroquinate synthase [Pseudomonadota bacterium]MDA0992404.1 3-dehydroquinate synthase [Pseudomonadota bacterium]
MTPHTLTVDLGARSYPIVIGAGVMDSGFDLSPHLEGGGCLVVSNVTVAPLYLEKLRKCLPGDEFACHLLPDGEIHKSMATAESILDKLIDVRAGRDTTVVALGGGVVGDIAGFAAACYMRGIAYIQVPTTLLAQVDSSVGGKTGINHPGGKNLIGAFHQPRLVLVDTHTLLTLPDRELRAGLAEVIKYGAIVDRDFFAWLEINMPALVKRDADALIYAIRRSCEIKAEVVAEDERESGKRALLNFGHTFGHAIENSMGYGEWLHGEAVAAGMVMAAQMSGIDCSELSRLKALINAAGLPVRPPPAGSAKLRQAMQMDKKVQAKKLRLVLLHRLGDAFVSTDYSGDALLETLGMADA